MNYITRYNKKAQEFLKTSYKLGGNGVAFDSMKQFKNFIFFHDIKVTSIRNANGSKILFLNQNLYKNCGIDLKLSDSIIPNSNDILVLQNGDYVLQQYKDNKLTSLFSGYHEKHNLVVNYKFAREILNKISFKGFDTNVPRQVNEIVTIEFIKGLNKLIAKVKHITIDQVLTSDEKKEVIRKYDNKYLDSIIMHHNDLFYIFAR